MGHKRLSGDWSNIIVTVDSFTGGESHLIVDHETEALKVSRRAPYGSGQW